MTDSPTKTAEQIIAEAVDSIHLSDWDDAQARCVESVTAAVHQSLSEAGLLVSGAPSKDVWLILLTPDSGAFRTREWRGKAKGEDEAIEAAMNANPGWSVHTFGPDMSAKPSSTSPVPVQVDETKLVERSAGE